MELSKIPPKLTFFPYRTKYRIAADYLFRRGGGNIRGRGDQHKWLNYNRIKIYGSKGPDHGEKERGVGAAMSLLIKSDDACNRLHLRGSLVR